MYKFKNPFPDIDLQIPTEQYLFLIITKYAIILIAVLVKKRYNFMFYRLLIIIIFFCIIITGIKWVFLN